MEIIHVYCACGAQWHGQYVIDAAPVIDAHRKRGGGCQVISQSEYERLGYRVVKGRSMATPTKKLDPTPRQYHVVLTDGERTITAADLEIRPNGALVLLRADDTVKVAYASGAWTAVELESQDE